MATATKSRAFPRAALTLGLLLVALGGCATKQAEDPRKILGDWMEHEGVDGSQGAQGSSQPRSTRTAAPPPKAASQKECKAAAQRIEELALELAVKDAESPEERDELEAARKKELGSPRFAARVEHATKECLGRETTSREAQCIARARSELDIDRCSGN